MIATTCCVPASTPPATSMTSTTIVSSGSDSVSAMAVRVMLPPRLPAGMVMVAPLRV